MLVKNGLDIVWALPSVGSWKLFSVCLGRGWPCILSVPVYAVQGLSFVCPTWKGVWFPSLNSKKGEGGGGAPWASVRRRMFLEVGLRGFRFYLRPSAITSIRPSF